MLRSYQRTLVDRVTASALRGESVIMTAPTGAGKTTMACEVARSAVRRGWVLWIVPRVEIHRQTVATIARAGLPVQELTAGQTAAWPDAGVLAAMALTLVKRLDRTVRPPALILVDEAHYAPELAAEVQRTWPRAACVGLTATPTREDARLHLVYRNGICAGPQYAALARARFLVPWRVLTAPEADLTGLAAGWSENDTASRFRGLTGSIVDTWRRHARTRRTLTFAASRDHGQALTRAYAAAGARVAYADSETPADTREALLAQLAAGELQVLVNVALWVEGVDVPAIDCITLAVATESARRYLQACGRASRPATGKSDALLIDHGGNVGRHGRPDADREWLLPSAREKRAAAPAARVPPAPTRSRSAPRTRPGDLVELPTVTPPPAVGTWPAERRPCPTEFSHLPHLWNALESERLRRKHPTSVVDFLMRQHARAAQVRTRLS